jgi:methionyl aminopeptidase
MSIKSPEELAKLQAIGRIVNRVVEEMRRHVRAGVTTAELDGVAGKVMKQNGARSAPALVYDFPGHTCISVNDEAVHGIPGNRELRDGDIVKLDVTAEKDGFMADAAVSVPVGKISLQAASLIRCAQLAFERALRVARHRVGIQEVGMVIEKEVRRSGFTVLPELSGHGIGRHIHEPPTIPNFADSTAGGVLSEGMVITIEPIIAVGSKDRAFTSSYVDKDGWTVRTSDGTLSAHYEHTIVITRGNPIVLTAT